MMTPSDETLTAGPEDENQRLDRFLAAKLPGLSRTRLQALIRQGQLKRNGETISDPEFRVKPGDSYTLTVPAPEPAALPAQAIELDIVYEDDQLLVIDKPAGLVVHPGAGNQEGTLVNALLAHCGESLSGIGGVARPGIVHRLDKDTSGLLVVAKTDPAHQGLSEQFADHGRTGDMERRYLALVWGAPSKPVGIVSAPIGRHPTSRTKMAILKPDNPQGREAVTRYRLLESYHLPDRDEPIASLVECTLETGRTHQVRLHMAHIGAPLVGDQIYGQGFKTKMLLLPDDLRRKTERLQRQALHATHLAFRHPLSDEFLAFDSEPPCDIAELIAGFKEL